MALHQRRDVRVLTPRQLVTLPVTRDCAILDLRRGLPQDKGERDTDAMAFNLLDQRWPGLSGQGLPLAKWNCCRFCFAGVGAHVGRA